MIKQFLIKRKNTNGAYNAARYIKAEAEKNKRSFLISFDGDVFTEEQMIEVAKMICESEGINSVFLADQRADELVEVAMEFVEFDATKDPLYEEATRICIEIGRFSPSALQRVLLIDYDRAEALAKRIKEEANWEEEMGQN